MGLFSKDKLKAIQEKVQATKRHTIFLVDDEETNLRSLTRVLESDYNILVASNGKEALNMIRNDAHPERINLIISDQRMPNLSGVEFLKETIRIIPNAVRMILTGFTDVEAIISSINDGQIYKFITKPIDPNELLISVRRGLEAFELEAENLGLIEKLKELNTSLEQKVNERTQELSQALERLQAAQEELVSSAKMAALGQLIAGIAHEINTPLGAIRTSNSNTSTALDETLLQLPKLFSLISKERQGDFFALLNRSLANKELFSSREKRQAKRALIEYLDERDIDQEDMIADILVDIGVYKDVDSFLLLFWEPDIEFILQTMYNLARIRRNNQNIDISINKASKVVFALKNYSHQDYDEKKTATQIAEGIKTVLTLYQNQLRNGIELITDLREVSPVLCYPDELSQVWTNLIHNALQAMDNKGRLEIIVQQVDRQVLVSVKDSGGGIPEDIKGRVFEPFFTTKASGEGSGLGLDICKKIIDKHDGRIEIDSKIGKGTTFTVFLPTENNHFLL